MQIHLSRNLPVNQPLQNNIQFNFVAPNPTIPAPQGIKTEATVLKNYTSINFADPSHQITFKQLNQNTQLPPLPILGNHSFTISGNPSINNFSPGPSLINSHRANNSSNIFMADQARTNS